MTYNVTFQKNNAFWVLIPSIIFDYDDSGFGEYAWSLALCFLTWEIALIKYANDK